MNDRDFCVRNGWVYVTGEHPNGDHCVMRFETKHWFAETIPFQTLFTWEIDEGKREKEIYVE